MKLNNFFKKKVKEFWDLICIKYKNDYNDLCLTYFIPLFTGALLPMACIELGRLVDAIFLLVKNFNLKWITGIHEDQTLKEVLDTISMNKTDFYPYMELKYPGIKVNEVMDNLIQANYHLYESQSSGSRGSDLSFSMKDSLIHDFNDAFFMVTLILIFAWISFILCTFILKKQRSPEMRSMRSGIFEYILHSPRFDFSYLNPRKFYNNYMSKTLSLEEAKTLSIALKYQRYMTILASVVTGYYIQSDLFSRLLFTNISKRSIQNSHAKIIDSYYEDYRQDIRKTYRNIKSILFYKNTEKLSQKFVKDLKTLSTGVLSLFYSCTTAVYVSICRLSHLYFFWDIFKKLLELYKDGPIRPGKIVCVVLCMILIDINVWEKFFAFSPALRDEEDLQRFDRIRDIQEISNSMAHTPDRTKNKSSSSSSSSQKSLAHSPSGDQARGEIQMDHYSFQYGPSGPLALNQVSLHCTPGQTVALVGESGSGKSTLLKVLAQESKTYHIFLDQIPFSDYDPQWLRSQIGYVPSEPVLFKGTIAENIALVSPQATEAEIEAAAKLANAHHWITTALPQGYQTRVRGQEGNEEKEEEEGEGEGEIRLSPSQQQLICLARAFLLQPPILLLDEVERSFDAQTLQHYQTSLTQPPLSDKTILLATRDLTTLKLVDTILVMQQGQIVESGTHKELMRQGQLYPRLISSDHGTSESKETFKLLNEEIKGHPNLSVHSTQPSRRVSSKRNEEDDPEKEEEEDLTYVEHSETEPLINKSTDSSSLSNSDDPDSNKKNSLTGKKSLNLKWLSEIFFFNTEVGLCNIGGIVCSLILGALEPVKAIVLTYCFMSFTKPSEDFSKAWEDWTSKLLTLILVLFALHFLRTVLLNLASQNLFVDYYQRMYQGLMRKNLKGWETFIRNDLYYEKSNGKLEDYYNNEYIFGKTTSLTLDQFETHVRHLAKMNDGLCALVELFTSLGVGFILAFRQESHLSWILSSVLVISLLKFVIRLFHPLVSSYTFNYLFKRSREVMVEATTHLPFVKLFQISDRFVQQYQEAIQEATYRMNLYDFLYYTLVSLDQFLWISVLGLQYVFKSFQVQANDQGPDLFNGLVVTLIFVFLKYSIKAKSRSVQYLNEGQASFPALQDYYKSLTKEDRSTPPLTDNTSTEKTQELPLKGAVTMNQLCFHHPLYPQQTPLNLGSQSIDIAAGETVVIHSRYTQSGVQTLLNLLVGFYEPDSGEVLVDGRPLSDEWKDHMAFISSEFKYDYDEVEQVTEEEETKFSLEETDALLEKLNLWSLVKDLKSPQEKLGAIVARALLRHPQILVIDDAAFSTLPMTDYLMIVEQTLREEIQRITTTTTTPTIIIFSEGCTPQQLLTRYGQIHRFIHIDHGNLILPDTLVNTEE